MTNSASSFSAGVGAPKLVPLRGGVDDGLDDRGMGVAEDHRAPGADVVDVAVAVDVPNVGAGAADEEGGLAADGAEGADRGIHAAGDKLFSALLQAAGLVETADHGPSEMKANMS